MKILLLLLFSLRALATDPVEVTSLYEIRSRVPGALVPFRIGGTTVVTGAEITNFKVINNGASDCRAMRDPFNAKMLLVKCASEAKGISLQMTIAGKLVNYGPFDISAPPDLVPIDNGDQHAILVATGAQLWSARTCNTCHTTFDTPANVRNKTAAEILDAMTHASMKSVPQLSQADADALSAYLGSQ